MRYEIRNANMKSYVIIDLSNGDNASELESSSAIYLFILTQFYRAALTGKHDTLVRRAPGWQGAPDGQQAKN